MEQFKAFIAALGANIKKYSLAAWEFIKKWAPIIWSNVCKYLKAAWLFITTQSKLLWSKLKSLTAKLEGLDEIADNKAVTISLISFILNIVLLLIVICD